MITRLKERLKQIDQEIEEIELDTKQIHERINESHKGDFSYLTKEEEELLLEVKKKLAPLRDEGVRLKRLLLSKEEKHQRRLNLLGLSKKFSNEGNNRISYNYGNLYLKLLIELEKLKTKDPSLREVYDYLDKKDFQYSIPNEYIEKLSSYSNLTELIKEMKLLIAKLSK